MRKVYVQPKMYVYALACANGLADGAPLSGSVTGGSGIGSGGNAGDHDNPPMDTKGDWSDIWDE